VPGVPGRVGRAAAASREQRGARKNKRELHGRASAPLNA
jgi:hypothetical protein